MADDTPSERDEGDGTMPTYFEDDERTQDLVDDAWLDPDAVSLVWLLPRNDLPEDTARLPDEPIDGAVVVIKGDANVRAFEAWAVEQGLLTRGQPIPDARQQTRVAAERN